MAKLNFLLLAGLTAKLVAAKDVHLDWNVTWVNAAPDGFERPVIGINNIYPCPEVNVELGDRVIVDVYNGLGNQSTGVHWHGFHQYHTGVMDGSTSVTQCPIPPGSHMRYTFDANQTGTYWYHSHNMGQYPDGFRGAFIVHDPKPPFQYDEEFTITLTEWYHRQMPDLLHEYQSAENLAAGGHEPIPDSALINDSNNAQFKVLPNKTYLVHIACVGNWPGHTWVFDGHDMTVVEVDGVYIEPYTVGSKMLRIAPGQRTSVLIHTKPDASQNFAIWDTIDINMMFIYENRPIPDGYNPNVTAWLVYDESKPLPPPPVLHEFNFVDDLDFTPLDRQAALGPVDKQIVLDTFTAAIDGIPRFVVNNHTYIPQDVPSLYTAKTIGKDLASNPEVYGQVNPFVVKYGEVVEIIINNYHNNLHPWHLHGHQFQVLQRTDVDGGYFNGTIGDLGHPPVRRDTIMVQNHGHAVIRFKADNPGVWLLHCHIEWHVEAGLIATIIEAPETFEQVEAPPKDHLAVCAAYPDPSNGNAAGKQGLDLNGANTKVNTDNHGAMYYPATLTGITSVRPTQTVKPTTASSPAWPFASGYSHGHHPRPQNQPAVAGAASAPVIPTHSVQAPATPSSSLVQAQSSTLQTHASATKARPSDIKVDPIYSAGSYKPAAPVHSAQPIAAFEHETSGEWPQPSTNEAGAMIGNACGDEPIVAYNEDSHGSWPESSENNAYVKSCHHVIQTHDNGPNTLPEGYEYWQPYANSQ
ncbi:hypothetical protein PDE_09453 [Penicillium oxalicum 114-2]|uniref:Uncharacterized protein n=1 Tax=Penicillium oxalicum (strain 114-2 / CGMCC 5302) TaxID=933388 RepID=S7ZVP1_PENO1|nr:hypothetical protein PDE_09453 [Penicillium oxalicum 114-2]